MPGVRYVPGGDMSALLQAAVEGQARKLAYRTSQGSSGLVATGRVSGDIGWRRQRAFSAGLLNGWTATGTRPEFKLVTGISTGALVAPFAFLGTKYDATLNEVYTTITPKDVLEPRNVLVWRSR